MFNVRAVAPKSLFKFAKKIQNISKLDNTLNDFCELYVEKWGDEWINGWMIQTLRYSRLFYMWLLVGSLFSGRLVRCSHSYSFFLSLAQLSSLPTSRTFISHCLPLKKTQGTDGGGFHTGVWQVLSLHLIYPSKVHEPLGSFFNFFESLIIKAI